MVFCGDVPVGNGTVVIDLEVSVLEGVETVVDNLESWPLEVEAVVSVDPYSGSVDEIVRISVTFPRNYKTDPVKIISY